MNYTMVVIFKLYRYNNFPTGCNFCSLGLVYRALSDDTDVDSLKAIYR